MPPTFLSISRSDDVQRRPSSAMGRLESGPATQRSRPQPKKQKQPVTFLSYSQLTSNDAPSLSRSSSTASSSAASASTTFSTYARRYEEEEEAPSASWSQKLLSNAQHISPSLAQQYALPSSASSTHTSTLRRPSSTRTPALTNLASRHLPSSPYLQHHLSILAQQLGDELTALHLTEREDDAAVQRAIKRAVRREMKQQTAARAEEEHKEEAIADSQPPQPPPVYPFTQHASALRQHVLTLSRLQARFDTLVESVSRSSSMHGLLSAFSSSYMALFSSLLSTLFSLNHHYHLTLHHASFTVTAQQAEHESTLSTLQHRLRLQSSATQSNHHLARIEQQQRQHSAQQIAHLQAVLRQQASDVQQQAQLTAAQVDRSTPAASMLELSGESFMQSHQLNLLLNALCYEAEQEAAERAKLDTLMDEGRKSAKEMWMNTVAKKKEDTAAKVKDREKQLVLAAATSAQAVPSPRGWAAAPYVANGFTLLPLLSRFMRGVQTLMSPRRNVASSLDSVNAQLVNILVALPTSVSVADFPAHLLSMIVAAQTNPQAAQRHLRSLFTYASAHCQHPLPRLVLPLISTYTGKAGQSAFSSGLTPRSGKAAEDAPPVPLIPPSSFTVHVVAESLRFLQPLIAASGGSDKELSFPVSLLKVQVPALLTAFFMPADDDGSLQSHLLSCLDAQSLLPAFPLIDLLLLFTSTYHDCLSDFIHELVGDGQLGWDELQQLMQTMCASETMWEMAGKVEVAKCYVEWTTRCGELAAGVGGDGEVDEVGVLLDVLSVHRWFMKEPVRRHSV